MLFLKPHICMTFSVVWTSLFLSGCCSSQWFAVGVHQIIWSEVKVLSHVTPWAVAYHTLPSMGFSRQEHWSGLLFTSPENLPNPGIEPTSPKSPVLASSSFATSTTWEAYVSMINWDNLLFLSACNAGDPGLIPGSGRSAGEGIGYPLQCSWASLVAQLVKNNAGDLGLIPGLGRSPGEGKGYLLGYSGLENSMKV